MTFLRFRTNNLLFLSIFFFVVFFPVASIAETTLTDRDSDGLSDEAEVQHGTNPDMNDTDGDGFLDGDEVSTGYSPLFGGKKKMTEVDSDSDKLHDALEILLGTNIHNKDTDSDTFSDATEVWSGYNPKDAADDATLPRQIEVNLSTQQVALRTNGIAVYEAPVSTGNLVTPTPVGTFSIRRKVQVKRYKGVGYDYPNTLWNLEFLPGYYLHTAYWHNDFGKRTRSHGCINMREKDAAFLYTYVDIGVPVVTIGKTPKRLFVGS